MLQVRSNTSKLYLRDKSNGYETTTVYNSTGECAEIFERAPK